MASRDACDNDLMSRDDDEPEQFPIAYSTAYLGLAALITIRDDPDEHYGAEATRYATHVLELIKAQPETVLHLPPGELEQTGPLLIDNSETWLT